MIFKTAATGGQRPQVDEDWGQASIFINLANRWYLKTVVGGIGSLRSPIPILLKSQEKILPSVACHGTFLLKKGTRKYICRCPSSIKKSCDKSQLSVKSFLVAEREGFEPPEPRSSTVFKTAAIDHSAISPGTKVLSFFESANFFAIFFKKIYLNGESGSFDITK